MTFESDRLSIAPTQAEDAEFLLDLMNTPKWHRFIGNRNIDTIEDAQEYIRKKMIFQFEALGYSNYTVILKSTGEKVGICGLYSREEYNDPDLGYALLPEFEGKGYAIESARCLLEAAFEYFNLERVGAVVDTENTASIDLLKKLGFERTPEIPTGTEGVDYYIATRS